MHFRHRSVDNARRGALLVLAAVACAVTALNCPAQELEGPAPAADSGSSSGRSSSMPLQERLRLYQQIRRSRPQRGESDSAESGKQNAESGEPGASATGGRNAEASSPPIYIPTQHPNEVVNPGDGPDVRSDRLQPVKGPAEAGHYEPGAGPRQASAMIPETIPATDAARDPNLLPPPLPTPPSPSTWQQIRQRGIAFQNSYTRGTWLFGGDDRLGMFDIYTQATFGFPLLPGVSFTPSFQAYFLDGPIRTDLPARLYSIQAEIRSLLPIGKSFVADLSVIPGAFGDFEDGDADSFRLQARVIGLYILSPQSQLVFGLLYLDRFDINWLPTGGWIYAPNADWRFELLFPRPKIGTRLAQGPDFSRWAYLAGEFGGDAWGVSRANGTTDQLVYRDLRLIVGVEQKYANGRMLFLEAGYVFSRKVEFESERGDFDPGSTGMLRAGLIY